VKFGRDESLTAGSLRIGTFEGSRPRLRRTRQVMGFELSFVPWFARIEASAEPRVGRREATMSGEGP
jgi:hypothetical protein